MDSTVTPDVTEILPVTRAGKRHYLQARERGEATCRSTVWSTRVLSPDRALPCTWRATVMMLRLTSLGSVPGNDLRPGMGGRGAVAAAPVPTPHQWDVNDAQRPGGRPDGAGPGGLAAAGPVLLLSEDRPQVVGPLKSRPGGVGICRLVRPPAAGYRTGSDRTAMSFPLRTAPLCPGDRD